MKKTHKTVRFTDAEISAIEKVMADNRLSFSEVVRTSVMGQLAEVTAQKNKVLSEEEREQALKDVATMAESLGHIKTDNARHGNNINQIARILNSGGGVKNTDEVLNAAAERLAMFTKVTIEMSERVNKIWQSLV